MQIRGRQGEIPLALAEHPSRECIGVDQALQLLQGERNRHLVFGRIEHKEHDGALKVLLRGGQDVERGFADLDDLVLATRLDLDEEVEGGGREVMGTNSFSEIVLNDVVGQISNLFWQILKLVEWGAMQTKLRKADTVLRGPKFKAFL